MNAGPSDQGDAEFAAMAAATLRGLAERIDRRPDYHPGAAAAIQALISTAADLERRRPIPPRAAIQAIVQATTAEVERALDI